MIRDEIKQDSPLNITLEQVWAAINELRECHKESDRKILELRKEIKQITQKTDRKNRKHSDGTIGISQVDETFDEEAEWIEEINEKIFKEFECNFGNLSDYLVRPLIERRFRKLGFDWTYSSQEYPVRDPEDYNNYAVINIMLENADTVIAIDVKVKTDKALVDTHVKTMEILRRAADKKQDKRKYRGAIAVAESNETIRKYIWQNGMYFIEQSGDTMKIVIPDGFIPREW